MTPTQNSGLYIHIPFCKSKCPYCDFYSVRSTEAAQAYTEGVKDELSSRRRISPFVSDKIASDDFDSVYFGGGTPSAIGASRIADILRTAEKGFKISADSEITVEVNPSLALPDEFFSCLKAHGVNRISLGLQSAVDGERRALGRLSTPENAVRAVKAAQKSGITDISLDIMLGIPLQTEKSLAYTLDFALSLGVTHLSCYMLQLEEGTVFFRRRDSLLLPDEDEVSDMYLLMCDTLKKHGMRHYEISNFCFDDNVSRHNMKYWTLAPYLGIGSSAHSFYDGNRFFFERDIQGFIDSHSAVFDCRGGDARERTMLLLRTDLGVAESEINTGKLDLFMKTGLLTSENGIVRLTDKGCLVSNSVISELI